MQYLMNLFLKKFKHFFLIHKADFHLRRMHIDIQKSTVNRQKQYHKRKAVCHRKSFVRSLNCFRDDRTFDIPAIDVIIHKVSCSSGNLRLSNKSFQFHPIFFHADRQYCFCDIRTKLLVNIVFHIAVSRSLYLRFPIPDKTETDFRMRQCKMKHHFTDITAFCRFCFQKFGSDRCIVKQIPYQKGGAIRASYFFVCHLFATMNLITASDQILFAFCDQFHLRHSCYTRKSLPTKSQTVNRKKVFYIFYFACRVAGKCHGNFFSGNPASIICNSYKGNATLLDLYRDGIRPCINCIFHKFFYNGSRALYNFPCRDLIDRRWIQKLYHPITLLTIYLLIRSAIYIPDSSHPSVSHGKGQYPAIQIKYPPNGMSSPYQK